MAAALSPAVLPGMAVSPPEYPDFGPAVPGWAPALSVPVPAAQPQSPEAPCLKTGWISCSLYPEGHSR